MSVLFVFELPFVDRDSVSEVFSLTSIEDFTFRAYYMMAYMMLLDRRFMSDLIFHVFSFLNVMDSPVIMRLHVPRLGSLHLVNVVAFEGVDENLAFVIKYIMN